MSLKFDILKKQTCNVQSADAPVDCTTPNEDGTTPSPDPTCTDLDACCADPAFAAANPELCANRTRLLLKPEFVSTPVLGTVQYKTFLVNANGQEVELDSGLTYSTSDILVAIIGAASGSLTALVEGVVTVTVAWQNLTAHAQLNVVAQCADAKVGMVLVIDNSKSMSQSFSLNYASRLGYAKSVARRIAGELNTTKDKIGLVSFSDTAVLVEALTNDTTTVRNQIQSLPSTTNKTDIFDGLKTAIDHLNAETLDRRVVILISDGENNDGQDPLPLADSFKAAGGLILVLGCRAQGQHFARLQKIANAGFFLNSYSSNELENADFLSGMKGYFCAGNCVPAGDEFIAKGALSYKAFKEWDVDGDVDLIGNGLYDFLPGNGLYVDMAGSGPPWRGKLISKRTFKFDNGVTYRLFMRLAGNQRVNLTGYTVRVTAGNVTLNQNTVTIDDWKQDFIAYAWDFVGDGSDGNRIAIEMLDLPPGSESFGVLLDEVRLDRINVPAALMLFDNFDEENLTYIVPGCGSVPTPPLPGKDLLNINATGPSWLPKNFRIGSWYSACMADDGAYQFIGEFSGKIVSSTDGGDTWSETSAPDNFWTGLACSAFGDIVLAVGYPGAFGVGSDIQIHTSSDTGANWTAHTVEAGQSWSGAACSDSGAMMAVCSWNFDTGYVYTSTDSGVNWTRRDAAGTGGFFAISMSANGTKIVAAYREKGTLKISVDSGVTWTPKIVDPQADFIRSVCMSPDGTKMVVCDKEHIYLSTDGGTTFVEQDISLEPEWVRVSMSSDGQKIIAGAGFTTGNGSCIAVSLDGGATWRRMFFGQAFWAVAMGHTGDRAIAAASQGPIRVAATVPLDPTNDKKGAAAVGSAGDFWNEWPGETPAETTIIPQRMAYADGSYPIKDIIMSQMVGGYDWAAEVVGNQPDALMKRQLKMGDIAAPTADWASCAQLAVFGDPTKGCRYVKITGLPEGNYDFYVYGHGDDNDENTRFRLSVDFDYSKELQTAEGPGFSGTWLKDVHYVIFEKVHVGAESIVYLFLLPPNGNSGGNQYSMFAGLQIKYVAAPAAPAQTEGCYGTGCLNEPPPEQTPDPSPLPVIE